MARFVPQRLVTMTGEPPIKEHLAALGELIESGKVTPIIDRIYPFAPSKVDLDAGEHTVSVTGPFRAPTKAGTYTFYCKYRYTGMDGRIIVRRS